MLRLYVASHLASQSFGRDVREKTQPCLLTGPRHVRLAHRPHGKKYLRDEKW